MTTEKRRTLGAVTALMLSMVMLFAATAGASHSDGGVDEPWIPEMNQESYWEARFDADCTKFENHSGAIPAGVDIAIIKDGNFVRVYQQPGPYTASGAVNPANGQHFAAPHSWVMKCSTEQSTTTTEPETTTSADITTTTEGTTSTTEQSSTTTTQPTETTTTTSASTTTSSPGVTSTLPVPSTTVPGAAEWAWGNTCDTISVTWGEGIVAVDFHFTGSPDADFTATEPGTFDAVVASPMQVELVPIADGDHFPDPASAFVTVEHCTPGPTDPSTTDGPGVLPFTGGPDPKLVALGVVLGLGGLITLGLSGRIEEE